MKQVGINLGKIAYHSPECPFTDLQKTARPWVTQNQQQFDTREHNLLDKDSNGWVKSLPLMGDDSVSYKWVYTAFQVDASCAGIYYCLYDGIGNIEFGGDSSLIDHDVVNKHYKIRISGNGKTLGVNYKITSINAGDYLRNIRIVPEEFKDNYFDQIFSPRFLESIDPFSGLRFMDWQGTNGSSKRDVMDNTPVSWYTYGDLNGKWQGAPIEICIELANATKKTPWFCIPHMATDTFVTEMASLINAFLDPQLRFVIEYSNEVWNGHFPQSDYAHNQAMINGLNNKHNWYAKRSTECIAIFENVFGADKTRFDAVLNCQASNPWTARQMIDTTLWDMVDPRPIQEYGVSGLTIAPYFANYIGHASNRRILKVWAQNTTVGLDNLFKEVFEGGILPNSLAGGALQSSIDTMNRFARATSQNGLALFGYEGGQHLNCGYYEDWQIENLFTLANLDQRMGDAYRQYLEAWEQCNIEPMHLFNHVRKHNKHGYWGLGQYLCSDEAKYVATKNFANS